MKKHEGRLFHDGAYGEHQKYYSALDVERLQDHNQQLKRDLKTACDAWNEARIKLAAFESTFAAGRAERPEVDEIRSARANGNLNEYSVYESLDVLLSTVTDLQRTEASWRNARDAWVAETERKELANKHLREGMQNLAEKVVSAEARLALMQRAMKWLTKCGAIRIFDDGSYFYGNTAAGNVPAEFAEIIKPREA